MTYVILIGILGAILVIGLLIRHYRELTLIQPETIAEYQDKKTKSQLLDDRFFRKLNKLSSRVDFIFGPLHQAIMSIYSRVETRIKKMEHEYKEHLKTLRPVDKEKEDKKIKVMILEAQDLVQEGKLGDAEKKYQEVLQMNHYNIEAFRALADLYFQQRKYDQAKETYEHILNLDKNNDEVYHYLGTIASDRGDLAHAEKYFLHAVRLDEQSALYNLDLGKVYFQLGNMDSARLYFETAVALEPANPRNLDTLLSFAVNTQDRDLAEDTYYKLKEVNPENGKLEEFRSQIDLLS